MTVPSSMVFPASVKIFACVNAYVVEGCVWPNAMAGSVQSALKARAMRKVSPVLFTAHPRAEQPQLRSRCHRIGAVLVSPPASLLQVFSLRVSFPRAFDRLAQHRAFSLP